MSVLYLFAILVALVKADCNCCHTVHNVTAERVKCLMNNFYCIFIEPVSKLEYKKNIKNLLRESGK